jgi:small redox-active disulfide protein 2
MIIKILGTGCPSCLKLEQNAKQAVEELQVSSEIEKVTNVMDIVNYGVLSAPALVIDEQVKSVGKILSVEEIKKIIQSI